VLEPRSGKLAAGNDHRDVDGGAAGY